jgi:hypothetical protein
LKRITALQVAVAHESNICCVSTVGPLESPERNRGITEKPKDKKDTPVHEELCPALDESWSIET